MDPDDATHSCAPRARRVLAACSPRACYVFARPVVSTDTYPNSISHSFVRNYDVLPISILYLKLNTGWQLYAAIDILWKQDTRHKGVTDPVSSKVKTTLVLTKCNFKASLISFRAVFSKGCVSSRSGFITSRNTNNYLQLNSRVRRHYNVMNMHRTQAISWNKMKCSASESANYVRTAIKYRKDFS